MMPGVDPRLALERAAVRDGELVFEADGGLGRALGVGCFALEIPAALDLAPGITLSREFYRASDDGDPRLRAYRGFRDRAGIYFDREHFQTEHLLLDRAGRAAHFPAPVIAMCEQMNDLALVVLRRVLVEVGVAPARWSEVTGGAVDDRGTHWFASSHYRPERELPGCAAHRDTGFVTVLYIDREGLEAWVDGAWIAVDPVPGCLVVNFGGALEILTARTHTPVRAIFHRVRQTRPAPGREDRFSFAAFVNPPATGRMYACDASGGVHAGQRVEEFLVEFNQSTWHDRHDDFGIRS